MEVINSVASRQVMVCAALSASRAIAPTSSKGFWRRIQSSRQARAQGLGRVSRANIEIGPTLTIGSHMLHACVGHHTSRTTSHHLRIRARIKASLRSHTGELLLLVIHHLLSGWLSSRLLLWGRVVERGSSIVAKVVAGGVHDGRQRRQCSASGGSA